MPTRRARQRARLQAVIDHLVRLYNPGSDPGGNADRLIAAFEDRLKRLGK